MAKGRDHETVKALEAHPKATLWKMEVEICVMTGLQE